MIKINPVFFDGEKEVNDSSLNFKGKKSPITRLALDIINKVQDLDDFKNPKFKGEIIYENKENVVNPPTNDIEIDVVFANRSEELYDYWFAPDDSMGFHCLQSGAFEKSDGDFISTKHRVLVTLDEDDLKTKIKENKNQFKNEECLILYMNTVTHELAHCLEWIENTNGLPPNEVEAMIQAGSIDYSLDDIITGNGILYPSNKCSDKDEIEDIMEDRVEAKGMFWLSQIEMDKKLIKKILKINNKKSLYKI